MPDLPPKKVGIVACSGEELAEGTVTRLAALKVLQQLRPNETVTICLPLFLAGGEGDRAFARFHPTITVDGCDLRCAARGTEMHSGKPAFSLVVTELAAQHGVGKIEGRRKLNAEGMKAVDCTAETLASLVDKILDKKNPGADEQNEPAGEVQATCSCGSGVPVSLLRIDGKIEEIAALPLMMRKLHEAGRRADSATIEELFAMVKVYNAVPENAEANYREALAKEYEAFCERESSE